MADEKYDPLTAYHEDLTRGLNPHVDCLVENFSRMSLLSEDELANLKAHKGPVKYLLDVVHARKEKHNDSQCFDELVKFMKGLQDTRLSELADKMRISQDDDAVPCVQAEQSQSSAVENCEFLNFISVCDGECVCMCAHTYCLSIVPCLTCNVYLYVFTVYV